MSSMGLLRKSNVLAVDDQRANLVALDAVLGTDYNLIFANSGHEALSILEKRQDIDVVLMDVQMPGMDGFETASRLKAMQGCEDIPVVFITAVYNEDPFVKQGYKAGAVDYFSKPFDAEILKVKVGIYASFRQRADILRERERQIRASEELRRVGRELCAMAESLRVGVIVTDAAGGFVGATPGWWEPDGRLMEAALKAQSHALCTGEASQNEVVEMPGPAGTVRTILCSASSLHGLDGGGVGTALVIQDLTERKRIEVDLERRMAELRHPATEPQLART